MVDDGMDAWKESERAPFILFKVGSHQIHLRKVTRWSSGHATSKCTWAGGRPGSAEPRSRSNPHGSHSSLSSSEMLTCGPDLIHGLHLPWPTRFLLFVGPPCSE